MKRFLQGLSGSSNAFVGKTYRIGRVECTIDDQIAEGGFSLVFVVKSSNGKHYALKRISVNNKKDLTIGKFEIAIMKKLSQHKNIITYIDSSITEVTPGIFELLILMEYCRDGHVIQLMNENFNKGLSEDIILRIFTDVCEALAALHHSQPPIVHRDLKVENILKNSCGDFVLCDYGSATTMPINPKECNLSEVEEEIQRFTTQSYRAPEMVDLYSGKIIYTKSDIWALGCLLYKLCFYTMPFGESVLAIQNGQFTIPESSKYSKEIHNLIRYMLEPDPDNRPDIYQVSYLAFQLRKVNCPVHNPSHSYAPKQLTEDVSKSATTGKSKVTRPTLEPVSTSVKARNRPRAGAVSPATGNTDVSSRDASSSVESGTLLHQALSYDKPDSSGIKNQPVQGSYSSSSSTLLTTFDQRSMKDSSPEFTHTRSRSDPSSIQKNVNMTQSTVGFAVHQPHVNAIHHSNHYQQPNTTSSQTQYEQERNFPQWNPFTNDFVLNTETSDEDFAALRPGPSPASQFIGGSSQTHFPNNSVKIPIDARVSESNKNTGEFEVFDSSRQKNAFFDGSFNAGCDTDEMSANFNRGTTLHETSHIAHREAIDGYCVFESAPFRKPMTNTPFSKTAPPFVDVERDPFGAVPFKQKEAAKLARRQARRSQKEQQSSGESRGLQQTVPNMARR